MTCLHAAIQISRLSCFRGQPYSALRAWVTQRDEHTELNVPTIRYVSVTMNEVLRQKIQVIFIKSTMALLILVGMYVKSALKVDIVICTTECLLFKTILLTTGAHPRALNAQ